MTRALFLVALAALVAAGGCAKPNVELTTGADNTVQADGLSVTVEIPHRILHFGQKLTVTLTAVNTTKEPIEVQAPTGAPVLIRLSRHTPLANEEIKYYPQSAITNITSWTLPPGKSRKWMLTIPVEPDWPAAEVLYLTAELNGFPKAAPSVAIVVQPPSEDRK